MFATIKSRLESAFNCKIYRNTLPHGTEIFMDLKKAFHESRFKKIFDVGGNIGQSALHYSDEFPEADIYSFEPVA